MPDASGGIASGLYWVVTGKFPLEDLKDKDKTKDQREEQDKKARR